VQPAVLVDGAVKGFHQGAVDSGLLPADSARVETINIRTTNDPDIAWLPFANAYDGLLKKIGQRGMSPSVGDAVVRGMVEALDDPLTVYYDSDTVQSRMSRGTAGVGVSLSVANQRGAPIVRELYPDSAALRAGLRVGDTITSIDGQSTSENTLSESADRIRGTPGTDVTLEVRSLGDSTSRRVRITRAPLAVAAVESSVRDGVEYVRVRGLPDGASDQIRTALEDSVSAGARGWVLDLRGNLSGSIDEGANLATLFIGSQLVGYRVDRQQQVTQIRGTGGALPQLLPTVLLVDQETGGGAELFAATLRDYQQAALTGKPTAGKVEIVRTAELSNGAALQMTAEHVYTAKRVPLSKIGLTPDEAVDLGVEDWSVGRDPQLERALQQARDLASAPS